MFVPVALSTADERTFRGGHARSVALGSVQISDIAIGSDVSMRRTRAACRRDAPEWLKVNVQLRGSCTFSQDGRQTQLTHGDYVVYDVTRPYEVASSSASHLYGVFLPRALLGIAPDRLSSLTARRFSRRQGLGGVVSPFLVQIGRWVTAGGHAGDIRLGDAVVDMLAASFAECLSSADDVRPMGRRGLLARVHSFAEAHLTDPELDNVVIARAHHISVRHLQRLFEEDGTTVTGWIRDRRIEHCRRDLLNDELADTPIASIGQRWGFTDPAHFSRVFKSAHGLAPRDYRQVHRPGEVRRRG